MGTYVNITHDSDSRKNKLYGKSPKIDRSPSGELSEYQIMASERTKIRNCVMYGDNNIQSTDKSYCMLCHTKCIPMNRNQLVDYYSQTNFLMVELVNKKTVYGQIYSWCKECGKWADRPDTEIVPVSTATQMCISCMHSPENMGRIKTLKPVNMPENRNDPNSPKK